MNSKITLFSLLVSVFITFCMAGLSEPSESYTTENACQKKARAQFEISMKKCNSGACRVSATNLWQSLYDKCPQGELYTLCRVERGAFNSCKSTVRQLKELSKEQCEEASKKTFKHTGTTYSPSDAHCILGPQRSCQAAFCQ